MTNINQDEGLWEKLISQTRKKQNKNEDNGLGFDWFTYMVVILKLKQIKHYQVNFKSVISNFVFFVILAF